MKIKSNFKLIASSIVLLSSILLNSGLANAAGSASYSLSVVSGSFTKGSNVILGLYENSGSQSVNAVQANINYDDAKLQLNFYPNNPTPRSADFSSSAFPVVAQASGGSGQIKIGAGAYSALTGKNLVAKISFKVLAGSGSTSLSFDSGTAIVESTNTNDIWNGDTSAGSFTLKTAPSTGGGTPKPSTGGTKPSSSTPSTSTTVSPSQEQHQKDNPTEPVPASLNTTQSGSTYLVAIKVLDSKNQPVKDAIVTLGTSTAKSDATGIAGFVGIAAGTYNVEAKQGNKVLGKSSITVDGSKAPADVQQFVLKAKNKLNWNLIAGIATLILAIIVIIGLWRGGKSGRIQKIANDHHGLDGSGNVQPGPVVGGQPTAPTVINGSGMPTPSATTGDDNLLKPTVISPNSSGPKV